PGQLIDLWLGNPELGSGSRQLSRAGHLPTSRLPAEVLLRRSSREDAIGHCLGTVWIRGTFRVLRRHTGAQKSWFGEGAGHVCREGLVQWLKGGRHHYVR